MTTFFLIPTPPGVGSFMGKNIKCLGHFMSYGENRYSLSAPTPGPHPIPWHGGGVRGEHFKVTKAVLKSISGIQLS